MKISDNHQVPTSGDISPLIKLSNAYVLHDFSSLTLFEIFQLVQLRLIKAETALRLAKEAGHVH